MIISIIIVIIAIIAFLFSPHASASSAHSQPSSDRQETLTPPPVIQEQRDVAQTIQEQHNTVHDPPVVRAKSPRKKVSFASRAEVRQFNIDTNQIVREYVRET